MLIKPWLSKVKDFTDVSFLDMTTATDPALNAAVTTAIVDIYGGVIITLTGAGNAQTIQSPTITTAGKTFTVVNNDTSGANTIAVNGFTITAGEAQSFIWDGSAWGPIDIGITAIPVPAVQGGTGQSTYTAGDLLYASSSTALSKLAAGATTEILVGGGVAVPVWTTATGTGAPVRAGSPVFTTQITTPAILAPAASLILKPTTDATTAIQLSDKDGNAIVTVDSTNDRVGIGTTGPGAKLEIGSGQIFTPNGTQTAPSYSFTNKTDSGFYVDTTYGILTSFAGKYRQTISGTTGDTGFTQVAVFSPSSTLLTDAKGFTTYSLGDTYAHGVNEAIRAGSAAFSSGGQANGLALIAPPVGDTSDIRFYTGGYAVANRRMTITNTGNVGIGTTAPNQKLTVQGSISLVDQAAAAADTAGYGQIWVSNATPDELWFTDDAGTDTQVSSHPQDAPAALYTNGPGLDWIGKRVQKYLGVIFWQQLNGTITEETFEAYNLRRKNAEGHMDLVKRDWDTVQVAQLRKAKLAEVIETEVTTADAFESVEIMEDVQTGTKSEGFTYVVDKDGKVTVTEKTSPVTTKQGTGKFEKKLKAGIAFNDKTGKFLSKRTMTEAEVTALNLKAPKMPTWMDSWLKSKE